MLLAIRQSLRRLQSAPAASLTALVTITVAFAANVAIFSVVDTVLLKPLPYSEPHRLIRLHNHPEGNPAITYEISHPEFMVARRDTRTLNGLAGHASSSGGLTVRVGDSLRQVPGAMVSGNLFEVLGVEPIAGRSWTDRDDQIGATPVVAISESLWRDLWAADPRLIGTSLEIGGTQHIVSTILPAGFEYPAGAVMWVPTSSVLPREMLENVQIRFFNAVGRLAPGRSANDAVAEINALLDSTTDKQLPAGAAASLTSESLEKELLSQHRTTLFFLLGAALLVLAIAAANVANLQTVRALAQRRDAAVRCALGARWRDLAKLSLLDSSLVVGTGCAIGSVLGAFAVKALLAMSPVDLFRSGEIELDLRIWSYAVLLAAMTALITGLLPLAAASARRISESLHDGGARSLGHGISRVALRGFVVAQTALAVVLVVGAVLLLQSFVRLSREDPGFDHRRVLTFGLVQDATVSNEPSDQDRLIEQVIERVGQLPTVERAGGVLLRPLQSLGGFDAPFFIEGRPPEDFDRHPTVNFEAATPDYFAAMGTPILSGRGFRSSDDEDSAPVAIISERLARTYFDGQDPVGQRIRFSGPGTDVPWIEVVGVVGDGRYRSLDQISLNVFVPHRQSDWALNHVVVRSKHLDPAALTAEVRTTIRQAGLGVEVADLATANEVLSRSLSGPRFQTLILGIFAALALILGTVGLYGVMSYLLSIRRQELGVRLALGAVGRDLVLLVLRESLALSLLGVAIGMAAALGLTRLLSDYLGAALYDVRANDPASLAAAVVTLLLAAVLAGLPPALRAGRTDPLQALRGE